MSEFDAARERYERRHEKRQQQSLGKQSAEMGAFFEKRPTLHLPKPPKTNGRNNEMDVEIFVNGRTIKLSFKVPFTGNLMASQLNEETLSRLLCEALSSKFGKVT